MWAELGPLQKRIEAFLRIGAELDAGSRLRARIIYLVSFVFIVVQLVNMLSLATVYGGWSFQHNIALATIGVFAAMTLLLRYTKSPLVFGLIFGALPLAAIGSSALSTDSWIDARGIETPLLPLLTASLAFIAYCGTRLTSVLTLLGTLGLIVLLHGHSVGLVANIDEPTRLIFYQRALQAVFTTMIVGIVAMVISRIIFQTVDRLEHTLKRAREAEAARTDLMNTMSHELRTPLNGIIAMADLVARDAKLDRNTKASVDLIQSSADTLLGMLDEALDRAKGEAAGHGAGSVAREAFSPAELLGEVAGLFEAAASKKSIWLGAPDMDGLPHALLGDQGRLRQVLSNLVGNAVKFTSAGGVRLGITLGAQYPDGHDVLFFVQDTGAGIAPEDQRRIFERFEQTETAALTQTKGTGLGLAICRELVEAMGGTLSLQSQVGRGSVFHFTLRMPVAQSPAQNAA